MTERSNGKSGEVLRVMMVRGVSMLTVVRSTGALDAALMNVSYFYNRDVKESVEKVQQLIEPMLTVVLGCLLGWIMLSVLGPVYDVISKIKT